MVLPAVFSRSPIMLHTTVQIHCDDCPAVSPVAPGISGTQLRRDMEAHGWTIVDRKDRCAGCTARRLERIAAERAAYKKAVAPV